MLSTILTFIIFLSFYSVHSATKLKDRFKDVLTVDNQLRLASLEIPGVLSIHVESEGTKMFESFFRHVFKGSNLTMVDPQTLELGEYNGNGSYTGVVGFVQSGRADIAIHVVRPDSIPFEPVRIGPVLSSSGVRIYRQNNISDVRDVDVLDVVHNFDGELYVFIAVTLFLLIAAMTSVQVIIQQTIIRKRKKTFKNLLRYLVNSIQESFFLIVDQEYLEPRQWSMRFLWTPFNFFVLVAIFGYLMNLMSSDQVATTPPDVIDGLEDLQDDKWRRQNVTPWIIKNLFFHSALHHVSNLSREGARLLQVRNRPDITFIEFAKVFSNIGKFISYFIKYLESGEMALLLTDFVMETLFLPAGCSLDPKVASLFHNSEESFANGVLTNYFYKGYPQGLIAYNEQRLRTAIEADVVLYFMRGVTAPIVGGVLPISTRLSVLKCLSRFTEKPDQNADHVKLRLIGLKSVFKFISFGICLSISVLFFEVVLHRACKNFRRWLRKRRQAKLQKIADQMQSGRRLQWRHHSVVSTFR